MCDLVVCLWLGMKRVFSFVTFLVTQVLGSIVIRFSYEIDLEVRVQWPKHFEVSIISSQSYMHFVSLMNCKKREHLFCLINWIFDNRPLSLAIIMLDKITCIKQLHMHTIYCLSDYVKQSLHFQCFLFLRCLSYVSIVIAFSLFKKL